MNTKNTRKSNSIPFSPSYSIVLVSFLIVNFLVLIISAMIMGDSVQSDWYVNQAKAPWTPPGWFFGVAWTVIMIAFSFYMAQLCNIRRFTKTNVLFFATAITGCIAWNALYFPFSAPILACIVLFATCVILSAMFIYNFRYMKKSSVLLIPFVVWTAIATSLNVYSIIYN